MCLDMYLEAEKYVGGYDHSILAEREFFNNVLDAIGLSNFRCEEASSLTVSLHVAYWRKANAIHKWFVDNIQGGKDECQKSYVTREQLQKLVDECKAVLNTVETVEGDIHISTIYHGDGRVEEKTEPGRVIAQTKIAEKKLPTQSGFFFGGTDYDEYYLRDLEQTVSQIEKVLKDERFNDFNFYYQASW